MCESNDVDGRDRKNYRMIPVHEAAGTVLAHDITEIRKDEFKGRSFRKGQVICSEDICHLQKLGKEHLFVLELKENEMHEDEAAVVLSRMLSGPGVKAGGEPKEGKVNLVAERQGLFKVQKEALLRLNMSGDLMCATLHDNTVVREGQIVAGTRAIPLVVERKMVENVVNDVREMLKKGNGSGARGILEIREMRKPRAGVVITGNEVYHGRIADSFAPVMREKIEAVRGEIVGIFYAPDDEHEIGARMRELLKAGADLLITTGGMSVDPDDVTRFAIRNLGASDIAYGSAALPGAMFLIAYIGKPHRPERAGQEAEQYFAGPDDAGLVPVLGIPACAMYHRTTIFDLILPRVLAGERIGRKELAELGHGGLCLNCRECRYPVCPFGK